MNLHIFNPEHDIALAYDKPHIMVPHVAKELRMNLGFLPSFCANDVDCSLVDDIKFAIKASSPFKHLMSDVLFVENEDLKSLPIDCVLPWGWDIHLAEELQNKGLQERVFPSQDELNEIRRLSGREHTAVILPKLRCGLEKVTCGEAFRCNNIQEVDSYIKKYKCIVVKAPWSSSGRGIRYVNGSCDEAKRFWIEKILLKQGYVMIEPHYNKVTDFALEFQIDNSGRVDYLGISVFHTVNGKYSGNIIASEEEKRFRLARYVDIDMVDELVERIKIIMPSLFRGKYVGPFGIDMMAVADVLSGKLLLHPCVEINLRRTMGHVALALSQKKFDYASMMSITHDVNYQFRIERIEGKFVDVIYN